MSTCILPDDNWTREGSQVKYMSGKCTMRKDQLTMIYFDNKFLNKYKKMKKNYKCILLLLDWWSFKFHTILLSFDSPSKIVINCMNFWWSLMDYQMIMKLYKIWMTINLKVEYIYKKKFTFKIFFIYLKIHYQSYQNNSLSMDPTHIQYIVTCT
jgi:hypothetical protein